MVRKRASIRNSIDPSIPTLCSLWHVPPSPTTPAAPGGCLRLFFTAGNGLPGLWNP
jgi:hypothetical protein